MTVTVGNQSEPISLDDTVGNKFGIAQESAAPSHAFGSWRSLGVRLHRAFQLDKVDRKLDIYDDETAFVTTSIGVFTKDIEETHQTDFAVTARLTGGGGWGKGDLHLGLSGSCREGEFRRISFRPEVAEADRITLARPEANTLGIAGLEGAYNRGPFHLQAEGYYAQYQGKVDGYGGGSYIQAGWFLTGDSRDYNARWGILAPHKPAGKYSVEVFGRISHTRGDDDANGWNDYKAVTLGCSLFFRRLRGSVNLVYAETREPIDGEHDGIAINVRGQILF